MPGRCFAPHVRVHRKSFGCTQSIGIVTVPRCTGSAERHVLLQSKRCTIQQAFVLVLASVVCVALVSHGHPASANNVVRKQKSSATYAAVSSHERGKLVIMQGDRLQAQVDADAGCSDWHISQV